MYRRDGACHDGEESCVCDLLEAFDVTAPSVSYYPTILREPDAVPFGLTGGRRSATMTGSVTPHGARQLKAKVLDVATSRGLLSFRAC